MTSQAQNIIRCDECGSLFYQNLSQMAGLCPECASYLYGYENCAHEMHNGRCKKCFWDGSVSNYIAQQKQKNAFHN